MENMVGRVLTMPPLISLTTILPRLPAEAQAWINALPPDDRQSTEYLMNLVGADNFVKHWRTHRDDWIETESETALDVLMRITAGDPGLSS